MTTLKVMHESGPLLESKEPLPHFSTPQFELPQGACDCHAHIFWSQQSHPLDPKRSFNPPRAGMEEYRKMLEALGIERAVIVHSAAYGTDNTATLDALEASEGAWRGIVLVDRTTSTTSMQQMHAQGVRGVRFNLIYGKAVNTEEIEEVARRIAPLGWHIQFLVDARDLPDLIPFFKRLPVDIVIDHMGRMPTHAGTQNEGFQCLLKLLRENRVWVKLSGANRMGDPTPPYPSTLPFARALLDANADRLVWGTDWPHVREPGVIPNDGDLLNLLHEWIPDTATRNAVLSKNPARLYGFEPFV